MKLPREDVRYLGLHFDRRLTWHKHMFAKRKQLGITLTKMYWFLGRKSKLSTSNRLFVYKTILKPIWTYGIQLWDTASTSNIEILEPVQSKALCMIVDAPWSVPNTVIRRDLQISEGRRPQGRPRRRCADNIKIDFSETGWGGVDWNGLAQDRDKWRALVNTVMNLRVP
jgi:hypothetical protein